MHKYLLYKMEKDTKTRIHRIKTSKGQRTSSSVSQSIHTTMGGDTMRLRFRVLVSDEVQQAPRLSDLSAPPSPASCDGELWKNTPLLLCYSTRVVGGEVHTNSQREEVQIEMESSDTSSPPKTSVKAESEKRATNHSSTSPCFMHASMLAAALLQKPKKPFLFPHILGFFQPAHLH